MSDDSEMLERMCEDLATASQNLERLVDRSPGVGFATIILLGICLKELLNIMTKSGELPYGGDNPDRSEWTLIDIFKHAAAISQHMQDLGIFDCISTEISEVMHKDNTIH